MSKPVAGYKQTSCKYCDVSGMVIMYKPACVHLVAVD